MATQLLMIEDDTRLAQMVGEYLGQSGMQVTHYADAAGGLAQLHRLENVGKGAARECRGRVTKKLPYRLLRIGSLFALKRNKNGFVHGLDGNLETERLRDW